MSAVVSPLEIRILLLERRVAELERRLGLPPSPGASPVDPTTIAIIAAAVAAAGYGRLRHATRISHVAPANQWADLGRQEHFYSHRVR